MGGAQIDRCGALVEEVVEDCTLFGRRRDGGRRPAFACPEWKPQRDARMMWRAPDTRRVVGAISAAEIVEHRPLSEIGLIRNIGRAVRDRFSNWRKTSPERFSDVMTWRGLNAHRLSTEGRHLAVDGGVGRLLDLGMDLVQLEEDRARVEQVERQESITVSAAVFTL